MLILLAIGHTGLRAQDIAGKRLLTVDDLFNFKDVSSPKVSPDGKWIAYTISETSLKDQKSTTRLWMKPVESGWQIPFVYLIPGEK